MHHDRLLVRLSKLMPAGRPPASADPLCDGDASVYDQVRAEAEAGDRDACVRLGRIHEGGWLGRRPEPLLAHRYYLEAALEEHAEAQYRLGVMAWHGMIDQPDPVAAWVWMTLAARNGWEEAAGALQAVTAAFTARDFRTAEALIGLWPRIKASNGRLMHFYRGLVQ